MSLTSGSSNSIDTKEFKEIDETEAQIYDRQIRLWGLEAQNRLRNSSVLLVGMGGLGAEVSKNLMLSGLKSLTLMDDQKTQDGDFASQFLIPHDRNFENRAKASEHNVHKLNPMVQLTALEESLTEKSDEFYGEFDLVILLDQSFETMNRVNKICRKNGIRFIAGGVYGCIGYAFFDFNGHLFLLPKAKEINNIEIVDDDVDGSKQTRHEVNDEYSHRLVVIEDDDDTKIKQLVSFPSFDQTFNVDLSSKKFIRKRFSIPSSYYLIRALLHLSDDASRKISSDLLVKQWKIELANARQNESSQSITVNDMTLFTIPALNPICAVVGSIIGQEAIKALSQNETPLKNVFTYSLLESAGFICDLSA